MPNTDEKASTLYKSFSLRDFTYKNLNSCKNEKLNTLINSPPYIRVEDFRSLSINY